MCVALRVTLMLSGLCFCQPPGARLRWPSCCPIGGADEVFGLLSSNSGSELRTGRGRYRTARHGGEPPDEGYRWGRGKICHKILQLPFVGARLLSYNGG